MEDYKENLKTYIKEDIIYQEYLKNKNKNFSDFDKFCIQHCKDIEELLEENQKLKEQLQQKEDIIDKVKEHLELKVIRYSNETDYILDETDLKEIIEILDNKGE